MKVFAIILSVAIASAVASPQSGLGNLGNIAGGNGGVLNVISSVLGPLNGITADNFNQNLSTDEVANLGETLRDLVQKVSGIVSGAPNSNQARQEVLPVLGEIGETLNKLVPGSPDIASLLGNLPTNPAGDAGLLSGLASILNISDLAQNVGN